MTLLEQFKNHKGHLIRIKTELYWVDGPGWDRHHGWDGSPGRVCLVMDASSTAPYVARTKNTRIFPYVMALLLIEGSSEWVWVDTETVEFINDPT